MTPKENLISIIKDAIKNDYDYIVLEISVNNSSIKTRIRYFSIDFAQQCLNIINKKYNENLINIYNHNISITSAAGAYESNTLSEIKSVLYENMLYILYSKRFY